MPASPTDASSRAWLDEGQVDPTWTPPEPGRRPLPRWVAPVAVVAALVLVLVLVWGAGGFGRRTDLLLDRPVGSLVTTGPYEFRFSSATAQQRTDYSGAVVWRVVMSGEGRTTGEESIAPLYADDNGMFVAKDETSGEIQTSDGQTLGVEKRIGGRFTPGLPLQPFEVQFEFSQDYRPQPVITLGVYQLEFRDSSLLGNQEKSWRNAERAYRFELPVTELPPAIS